MSWPHLPTFGIVDNPLIDSPFVSNNDEESGGFANNDFLLMDGEFFNLMDGTHLLLMGT